MKINEKWPETIASSADIVVPQAEALRPGLESVIQYVRDGHEYLAVRSSEPYGVLTGASFVSAETPRPAYFLKGVERGADFTTFEVPEEALALKALTLGTGRERVGLLREAYRDVGRLLGDIATRPGAKAPLLGTEDIAIDRHSGEIILIPPIRFGDGGYEPGRYEEAFLRSVYESFGEFWPIDAAELIAEEIKQGVEDGSQRT